MKLNIPDYPMGNYKIEYYEFLRPEGETAGLWSMMRTADKDTLGEVLTHMKESSEVHAATGVAINTKTNEVIAVSEIRSTPKSLCGDYVTANTTFDRECSIYSSNTPEAQTILGELRLDHKIAETSEISLAYRQFHDSVYQNLDIISEEDVGGESSPESHMERSPGDLHGVKEVTDGESITKEVKVTLRGDIYYPFDIDGFPQDFENAVEDDGQLVTEYIPELEDVVNELTSVSDEDMDITNTSYSIVSVIPKAGSVYTVTISVNLVAEGFIKQWVLDERVANDRAEDRAEDRFDSMREDGY